MAEQYDQQLLLDYVEGELSSDDQGRVERWMRKDPRLATLIEGMLADRQALREMPDPTPPEWLMEEVDRRLERTMLVDHAPDPAQAQVVRQRHLLRRLTVGLSAAALITLVAGLIVWSLLGINPGPDPARQVAQRQTDPSEGPAAAAEPRSRAADPSARPGAADAEIEPQAAERPAAGDDAADSAMAAADGGQEAVSRNTEGETAPLASAKAEAEPEPKSAADSAAEMAQGDAADAETSPPDRTPPPLIARSGQPDPTMRGDGTSDGEGSVGSGGTSGGAGFAARSGGSMASSGSAAERAETEQAPDDGDAQRTTAFQPELHRLPDYLQPDAESPGALAGLIGGVGGAGAAEQGPADSEVSFASGAGEAEAALEAALRRGPGEQDVAGVAQQLRALRDRADRVELRIVSRDPEATRQRIRSLMGERGRAGHVFGNASRTRDLQAPESMTEPDPEPLFPERRMNQAPEAGRDASEPQRDADSSLRVPVDRLDGLIEALRNDPAQRELHFTRTSGAPVGSTARTAFAPWPAAEPDYQAILEQQAGPAVPATDDAASAERAGSSVDTSDGASEAGQTTSEQGGDGAANREAPSPRIVIQIEAAEAEAAEDATEPGGEAGNAEPSDPDANVNSPAASPAPDADE